jgi:hypothetical protein
VAPAKAGLAGLREKAAALGPVGLRERGAPRVADPTAA